MRRVTLLSLIIAVFAVPAAAGAGTQPSDVKGSSCDNPYKRTYDSHRDPFDKGNRKHIRLEFDTAENPDGTTDQIVIARPKPNDGSVIICRVAVRFTDGSKFVSHNPKGIKRRFRIGEHYRYVDYVQVTAADA